MSEESVHADPCWYVSREGKQHGPYTDSELIRLAGLAKLRADDLVWKPGFTNWKPVSEIPGIVTPFSGQHALPPAPPLGPHNHPNDPVRTWIEQTPRRWARNGAIIGTILGVPSVATSGAFVLFFSATFLSALAYVAGLLTRHRLHEQRVLSTERFSSAINRLPARYAAWGGAVGASISLADFLFEWRGSKLVSWQTSEGASENIGYLVGAILAPALFGFIIGIVLRWRLRKRLSEAELKASFPDTVTCKAAARPRTTPGTEPSESKTNTLSVSSLTQRRHNHSNFIARYWRGEFPLWVSYWIFGFLGNIATGLIAILVTVLFVGDSDYQPVPIFFTFLFLWFSIGLLGTWQIVGVWRSAERYTKERRRDGKTAFGGGLAQAMMIIGLLGLGRAFGEAGLPQMAETFRMAWMGDPDIPDYSLRIMRNGTELEVTGGIKYGLTDDVLRLIDASPQIRVVHLNSVGGRIGEAKKLNRVIRDNKLITFVSGKCLSACTVVYAGGEQRWIQKGAELGFHASFFPGTEDENYIDTEQKDAFQQAGFAEGFIARALSTPHDEMWTPLLSELLQSRVVTSISDGSDFAASGLGGPLTKEQMSAKLTSALPALAALKEKSPESHASIIDTFYAAYLNGETQEAAIDAARQKFMPLVKKYLPLANDEVLVAYGKLVAEQYAALGEIDSELCYRFAYEPGERNFSKNIPSALLKRELILQERVIATANRRAKVTEAMTGPLWEMIVRSMEPSHVAALEKEPTSGTYSDYCDASISMFDAITSLPEKQAGIVLRELWSVPP